MAEEVETLRIEGMHCASCAATVEKALAGVSGVSRASVNLATERALVRFDPGTADVRDLMWAVDRAGYTARSGGSEPLAGADRAEARRALVAWALTTPLVVLMAARMLVGAEIVPAAWYGLVAFASSALVLSTCGRPTLLGGLRSIARRAPDMNSLVAIGTLVSLASGAPALLRFLGIGSGFEGFADISGMIMAVFLTGRSIETLARRRASRAIGRLSTVRVREALVERDGAELTLPIEEVVPGDVVIARPGSRIPLDGVIVEGGGAVDESVATGEPMPIAKRPGDAVIGSTMSLDGFLKIRVTKVGEDTFLARVAGLIEEAQGSKVPVQRFADRVVALFVPGIFLLALGTLVAWLSAPSVMGAAAERAAAFVPWAGAAGSSSRALFAAIAVLVIACPCALALATPTALVAGTALGARNGILLRRGAALQTLRDVTTVVFDKTGTITEGAPRVTDVVPLGVAPASELLRLAASAERGSEHPIGRAVREHAREAGAELSAPTRFAAIPGRGVRAVVEGRAMLVGGSALLAEEGVPVSSAQASERARAESQGKTVALVALDGALSGLIAVADRVRPGAARAIEELKALGIEPVMLTGDGVRSARSIACEVGIERISAGLLPGDKAEEVKRLQEAGRLVAMVGDGVNDAPALAQADVGMALATGADIAVEAGDIVLAQASLSAIAKAVRLSRATLRTIKRNLLWAALYNLVCVPAAALGLLHPVLAEAAMALSSITVIASSFALQRARLDPGPQYLKAELPMNSRRIESSGT